MMVMLDAMAYKAEGCVPEDEAEGTQDVLDELAADDDEMDTMVSQRMKFQHHLFWRSYWCKCHPLIGH